MALGCGSAWSFLVVGGMASPLFLSGASMRIGDGVLGCGGWTTLKASYRDWRMWLYSSGVRGLCSGCGFLGEGIGIVALVSIGEGVRGKYAGRCGFHGVRSGV